MTVHIEPVAIADYPGLVEIWSSSVLATHDFLTSSDYEEIKQQLIPAYFPAVTLYKATSHSDQTILGFLGVLDGCVEMLFIDASARGQGVGKALLNFAVQQLSATKLDVNEQNSQAVGFYLHYGCSQVGRSELDAAGKPYPLLHLLLPNQ
ncbi:GNAT family N-acetyltransferase [Paenalcaligenes suwonensis]|uniref:GNAT family N-acetyltransferase n=1 Tax=Paenalcaligenes suwonensis TaxID=1202713 RepID=UPI0014085FFC|nr:GNAT family N-acetyltransferase [Paenalcaligenes suwonensis]NHC62343.1 GNAT family N-acetyltransferase [Paenalcaligenes suwonensis]